MPTSLVLPRDLHAALATAAEGFDAELAKRIFKPSDLSDELAAAAVGFPAWDVLDAAHMLVASLIVDLVADADRPGFLRKMDRVLRDRVKEIAARQKPALLVP